MPPRGHSGSSHHSSGSSRSFSSSSSHSSHSSSSHYSSSGRSYSSGSSYRSRSSYSSGPSRSSSSHYSGLSGNSYRPNRGPSLSMPRNRTNQPRGYQNSKNHPAPREYHCKNHDYVYFPVGWQDQYSGQYYKKGYYDETGKWYEDVVIRDTQTGEARFTCQYCGTEVRTKWTEGTKPTCPNCSAQMEESESTDEISRSVTLRQRMSVLTSSDPDLITRIICFALLALLALGLGVPACMQVLTEPSSIVETSSGSIYVEEIGRTCWTDSETGDYYDPVTECWFWFNDENGYPSWQYWYEGISSNYGDYGWMEFDEAEQIWYIETDYGNWIPLPEEYITDYLWHIQE